MLPPNDFPASCHVAGGDRARPGRHAGHAHIQRPSRQLQMAPGRKLQDLTADELYGAATDTKDRIRFVPRAPAVGCDRVGCKFICTDRMYV